MRGFLRRWVLFTGIGVGVSMMILEIMLQFDGYNVGDVFIEGWFMLDYDGAYETTTNLSGMEAAAILALAFAPAWIPQWWVLRRHVAQVAWWVPVSVAGHFVSTIAAFMVVAVLAIEGVPFDTGDVMFSGLTGTGVGMSQWWVLRRKVASAIRWVPVSAIMFGLIMLSTLYPQYLILAVSLNIIGSSLLYGSVTGLTLVKLLPKSRAR